MQDLLRNQLVKLHQATEEYKSINPLATWIYGAVNWYISTRRAPKEFEQAFIKYDSKKFPQLIKKCLSDDTSDEGIINTTKRIFKCKN